MSATYVNQGRRITYSNSGSAIAAGDVVVLASGTTGTIAVAVEDIAATTGTGTVEREGRYTLAKATGEAFTQDQVLYWTGSALTGASTSNTRAGRAAAPAASADTTADVLLNVA